MAEQDDIKELIGRMAGAQRQGFHVTPGALRIVVAALRFYLAALPGLASRPRADPHDDAPRKPPDRYTGPPATITDLRSQGLIAVMVTCDGPNCWNTKRVTFDDLALADTTAVPAIATSRRFRCLKCGCRRVRVSPDWSDHRAQGGGRAGPRDGR